MVGFSANINSLRASGGTDIMSGLNLGLKTIRDRKTPNKVTSIFLLSDGQDKGAE
jgi:Mg-chelatase subunit ChlD